MGSPRYVTSIFTKLYVKFIVLAGRKKVGEDIPIRRELLPNYNVKYYRQFRVEKNSQASESLHVAWASL